MLGCDEGRFDKSFLRVLWKWVSKHFGMLGKELAIEILGAATWR